jgi:mono/diheme cytochrome c family protein
MRPKKFFVWAAVAVVLSNHPQGAHSATSDASGGSVPATAKQSIVERGKYLADAGNCFSCHTTEAGAPYTGGVPFETPFGTIYSTNITPDEKTGIGSWSRQQFRRALHEGIAADGSFLFPAFPYTAYTKVSDADVDAIYAFLRTLKPVRYTPPENGFIFSMRWPMRIWNSMFFKEGRFVADSKQTPEWNRGAYLVEGLGHCGACHSPRNYMMAEISEQALEGGVISDKVAPNKVRPWSAVNLTPSKNGLGSWSVTDLTKYLHSGFSPRAGTFGPMNEVIVNSLKKLSAEDVRAMAVYLKSLPVKEYTGANVTPDQAKAGAAIYEDRCEDCHSTSGRGGIFSAPPLAGSAIVQADNPASLINVVLHGPQLPKEVSFGAWENMPAYADKLSDEEVVAVSNYIRGSWGNVGRPLTTEEVAAQR